jgi:DNA invertase Pin-like site-specific DNA recombinase
MAKLSAGIGLRTRPTALTTQKHLPTGRVPIVGKAAIYTRVSTDKQEHGASLEVQVQACRKYCEANGLVVVEEFRDVLSGLNPERPKYRQAIAMAMSKTVDKLIVWRMDRLGRDLAEYATQLRDLNREGVDVVSVTQPGESMMIQQIHGVLAEQESRDKSVRVAASKLHRAKEGKWNGATPLGYDRKPAPDGRGYVLAPNREAGLVRELFTMYASGKYSVRIVRDFLNKKRRRAVTRAAVWNLLKNPAYIGMVRHGQWSNSRFMPRPEVTISQGLHPAIVDKALFDNVQARLKSNAKIRGRGGLAPTHLFAGLVHCGECGRRFVGHMNVPKNAYYYCNRSKGAGDCKAAGVPESRLREAVITPLEDLISRLQRKDMRKMVRGELERYRVTAEHEEDSARSDLEQRYQNLDARLERLEDTYLDESISRDRFLSRRDGIMAELGEVKAKLAKTKPKASSVDRDQLFVKFGWTDEEIDRAVVKPIDDEEWREIVVETVERVVIVDGDASVTWLEPYRSVLPLA